MPAWLRWTATVCVVGFDHQDGASPRSEPGATLGTGGRRAYRREHGPTCGISLCLEEARHACARWDTYPDIREFNGVGIQPDLLVRATPGDFRAGRDPVLEAALEGLETGGAPLTRPIG